MSSGSFDLTLSVSFPFMSHAGAIPSAAGKIASDFGKQEFAALVDATIDPSISVEEGANGVKEDAGFIEGGLLLGFAQPAYIFANDVSGDISQTATISTAAPQIEAIPILEPLIDDAPVKQSELIVPSEVVMSGKSALQTGGQTILPPASSDQPLDHSQEIMTAAALGLALPESISDVGLGEDAEAHRSANAVSVNLDVSQVVTTSHEPSEVGSTFATHANLISDLPVSPGISSENSSVIKNKPSDMLGDEIFLASKEPVVRPVVIKITSEPSKQDQNPSIEIKSLTRVSEPPSAQMSEVVDIASSDIGERKAIVLEDGDIDSQPSLKEVREGHAGKTLENGSRSDGDASSQNSRGQPPQSEPKTFTPTSQHIILPDSISSVKGVGSPVPPQSAPAATGSMPNVTVAVATEIAAQHRLGASRFDIRLDPPELGRIDVRLDVDKGGKVRSRLIVERAETLDMLRSDMRNLEKALEQAGLKADPNGISLGLRDDRGASSQNGRMFDLEPQENNARESPSEEIVASAVSSQPKRVTGQSGLDIRV